jgi:hypothetical protein
MSTPPSHSMGQRSSAWRTPLTKKESGFNLNLCSMSNDNNDHFCIDKNRFSWFKKHSQRSVDE